MLGSNISEKNTGFRCMFTLWCPLWPLYIVIYNPCNGMLSLFQDIKYIENDVIHYIPWHMLIALFCFVFLYLYAHMYSYGLFAHILQGCFTGTWTVIMLPQCQWLNSSLVVIDSGDVLCLKALRFPEPMLSTVYETYGLNRIQMLDWGIPAR